jgi:hypothetical protein
VPGRATLPGSITVRRHATLPGRERSTGNRVGVRWAGGPGATDQGVGGGPDLDQPGTWAHSRTSLPLATTSATLGSEGPNDGASLRMWLRSPKLDQQYAL